MTQKPTVLYLIDSLGFGGAEHLVRSTVNETSGTYTNLVVHLAPPTDLQAQIHGAKVICLNRGQKAVIPIVRDLRRIIRREDVDVVTAHSYWTNIYARLATPRGVGLINTYHFSEYDTMQGTAGVRRMVALDKLTHSRRLNIVCVSDYVQDILRRHCGYREHIRTIPNFVEGAGAGPAAHPVPAAIDPEHPLRLVAVGSVKKEKNYDLLIEAFKTLKDAPVVMDVWGGGAALPAYRERVAAAGIANLHFRGSHPDIPGLLPTYDAYVMCSFSEACPLSPLEAMIAGLPLVLSDIPPLREIAAGGAHFFENRNAADFARVIRDILPNPGSLRPDLGFYAQRLPRYSRDSYLTALTHLYREVLS